MAVEGRIDPGQASAVLRLLLQQGLRPGVDLSSGIKGHPLRQLVVSLGVFSVMFMPNAWRYADFASYLVALCAASLTLVLLAIMPETQEARERHVEILGSKPLARRTLFAARGALLGILGTLVVTAFGLLPLLAARLRFGTPYLRLGAAYLSLVLGAYAAAVAGLVLVVLALKRWPATRVRRVSQTLLAVFFVGLSIASLSGGPFQALLGGQAVVSTLAGGVVEWLPSTWFARLAAAGGPSVGAERVLALVLIGVAMVLGLGGGLEHVLPSLAETAPVPEASATAPLARRVVRVFARLPLVGPLGLPDRAAAIAELILLSSRREELARSRELAIQLMSVAAFAFVVTRSLAPGVSVALFLYFVMASAMEGVRIARQSTSPAAGWIFQAAPLRGAELLRGIEAAALLRAVGLPLLFFVVISFRQHPAGLAALLGIGVLAALKLAVSVAVVVDPGPPLSREPTVSSFGGLAVALMASWLLVAGYATLVLLAGFLGAWAPAVVVAADVGIVVSAWACGTLAAWRLERTLSQA